MKRYSVLIGLVAFASVSQASITVATFADPSLSSNAPMFTWDSGASTLQGSWKQPGLTLITPGLIGGGSYSNVTMQTNLIALTPIIPNTYYSMGRGVIDFFDSSGGALFNIQFSSGSFLNPFNAGASDVNLDNVIFGGPKVANLTNEHFSFSFANPVTAGTQHTFTASFTSSADVVPEPATIGVLGLGILALKKRRARS